MRGKIADKLLLVMEQSNSKGKEAKAMSRLLRLGLLFFAPLVGADESSIELVLSKLEAEVKANQRPMNLPALLVGIEDDLVGLPEQAKTRVVIRTLSLTVGMLGLRDRTLPADRSVSRWPAFDWKKYGATPLFAGASPDAIPDKTTREAYVKALEAHDVLLSKVAAEKSFLEDVDYFLSLERRVIKSSASPQGIFDAASSYLSTPEVSQSAAEYIRQRLFDPPPAKATDPPQLITDKETAPMNSRPMAPAALKSQPTEQPPAAKTAPEVKVSSTSGVELASSRPWSIIVVLIVAAIGLLWLLIKGRK